MTKQKKIFGIAFSIAFALIALTSFSSATIFCDVSSGSPLILTNTMPSAQFSCSNSDTQSIAVTTSGAFTLDANTLAPNSSHLFTATILNPPSGYSAGLINFGNLYFVPVNITTPQSGQQQNPSDCNINPSLISYSQNIQVGTQTSLPLITFSPINCNSSVVALTSSSVNIQGGILTSSGQKPIAVSSITPNSISLSIDTTGLSSQTYTSTLNINQFGKTFQIPFTIIVTSGTSPVGNFSVANLPTCSLSSSSLNLNSSYALTCTNLQPDVTIIPSVDNNYIRGVGVDSSTTQFIWFFQANRAGSTNITANFYYHNAPVGNPFSQAVAISGSGNVIPGNGLQLVFTPDLSVAKPGKNVIVQIIDNSSGSLVSNAQLFVNAMLQNGTGYSFTYSFDLGQNYSFRAVASGYPDLVKIISLISQPININITPTSGDSNTIFNITTNVNSTLLIDGNTVSNPYFATLSSGYHDILAVQEGYFNAEINITIDPALSATTTPQILKKGQSTLLSISTNSSWDLYYQKDSYSDKTLLQNGTGNTIQFTPDNYGSYILQTTDGKPIWSSSIVSNGFKILGINGWVFLGVSIIIIFLIYLALSSKSKSADLPAFGGSINAPQ